MNNTLSSILIFAVGAAIGSAVTWKLIKDKYVKIADEEIESMREYYKNKYDKNEGDADVKPAEDSKKIQEGTTTPEGEVFNVREYAALLAEKKYNIYSNKKAGEDADSEDELKPYVITPDEYGEKDYDLVTLTYFEDGVLLEDTTDEVIENVDDVIGEDSLERFGEYADDSLFVRNERLETDYEILRDVRTYAEYINSNPYSTEDE
jgi:hypothetical protein